ncbi:hypothetical protein OIU76_026970 [Salix suchowensis]|nr:hypothetical protein OIU76_026970 [Salix suchowensis]
MGFRFIRAFIQNYGYGARSVYNSTYVVNYFVAGSTWINFDDVETVRAKISYAKEKGLLGYNVFQVINDDNWALSLAAQDEVRQGKRSWLWLKIVLPIALISILLASLMFYCRKKLFERKGTRVLGDRILSGRGTSLSAAAENFDSDAPALQVFSFESIKAATNNFSSENQLGRGGFGPVYKVLYEYAYDLWKNRRVIEFIDPFLDDSSSPCKLETCMQVALLCVQENPDARPTMLEAFSMLKSDDSLTISTPEGP